MNLPKAIEILSYRVKTGRPPEEQDYRDALKLGIEALERWKERHDRCPDDINFLLPGETPENKGR